MGQVGAALRAELVGVGDFAAALRARRMQVVLTAGAEIVARRDDRGALRAREGQRLANEQVDDEADDAVGRGEYKDEQSPENGMHAAALGVLVNVTEHEEECREEDGTGGDHASQGEAGGNRIAEPFRVGREKITLIVPHVVNVGGDADDNGDEPESDAGPEQPARNDAEFVAESGALALPAESDHTHAFIK